eukprot:3044908-Pyramimonas_sp.AAC.1
MADGANHALERLWERLYHQNLSDRQRGGPGRNTRGGELGRGAKGMEPDDPVQVDASEEVA